MGTAMGWHSSISECNFVLCIVHVTRLFFDHYFISLLHRSLQAPWALLHISAQTHAHPHCIAIWLKQQVELLLLKLPSAMTMVHLQLAV